MVFSAIFDRSIQEQKPLSLIRNSDRDFWFGIISHYNEEALEVKRYDSFGEFDGFMIYETDEVLSIEFDDEYEQMLTFLISENSFLTHNPDSKLDGLGSNWRYHVLSTLSSYHLPLDIIENSKSHIGMVKNVNFETVEIECIGSMGDDFGSLIFKLEDVSSICYYSRKIKKAAILHEWRKHNKK